MDKERAKFVLRSFRPDGADVDGGDFADALRLATTDREMGEWLMRERAFDAEFAEAFARVELPEDLRQSVLLAMISDGAEYPKVDLEEEERMKQAFREIPIPDILRGKVLEAMDRTGQARKVARGGWRRIAVPLAAAACIGILFLVMHRESREVEVGKTEVPERIPIEAVQESFVEIYESPGFRLEKWNPDRATLVAHLRGEGWPAGDIQFPPGLENFRGLGCRGMVVDGKRGSLICLVETSGILHLLVFRREDIKGELPGIGVPAISKDGKWAMASWGDRVHACTLIGKCEKDELAAVF